jgi:outer membrane protein TolC
MKTYINKFTMLLFILFLGYSELIEAQGKIQLIDLETVLKIGGANNLTIQEYRQRQELALADLTRAREWWLPDIYSGASIHQLWGNALNSNGTIYTDVNRQSFQGGIGLNASWKFGDGIFKANAAELKAQATSYQTQAEKNKALLEILETYYDFLATQLYHKSYEQLVAQADTIADQIAIQVEAGLRYESELLLVRSNHNHLKVEMLNARTEHNNKSAMLVKLLNLDPAIKLLGTDVILAPLELVSTENMTVSFNSVYQNRPELKSMNLMLQSLNTEKKTTTTGLLLPELNMGAYGSFFGDVFSQIKPTGEINASLTWKIPLGRLINGGTLKQFDTRIALQETHIAQIKAQVNEEVISAKQQIIIAKEQMKVALEGSQLAQKALKQSLQRQQMGTVRPFEVVQAQEIYLKLRLDFLKTVALYNKVQYRLFVAIGNDL